MFDSSFRNNPGGAPSKKQSVQNEHFKSKKTAEKIVKQ
jgi:hypothetical protein